MTYETSANVLDEEPTPNEGDTTAKVAEEIFFENADKFVTNANGSMPDLNLTDSFMPEILNDVCNEVTIYTDL